MTFQVRCSIGLRCLGLGFGGLVRRSGLSRTGFVFIELLVDDIYEYEYNGYGGQDKENGFDDRRYERAGGLFLRGRLLLELCSWLGGEVLQGLDVEGSLNSFHLHI